MKMLKAISINSKLRSLADLFHDWFHEMTQIPYFRAFFLKRVVLVAFRRPVA